MLSWLTSIDSYDAGGEYPIVWINNRVFLLRIEGFLVLNLAMNSIIKGNKSTPPEKNHLLELSKSGELIIGLYESIKMLGN